MVIFAAQYELPRNRPGFTLRVTPPPHVHLGHSCVHLPREEREAGLDAGHAGGEAHRG